MRRLTKIVASFVCVAVMLLGGGCSSSSKMNEIFEGNYIEVSEETVKDFAMNLKSVANAEAIKELINNTGGINYIGEGRAAGALIAKAEGKYLQKADHSYEYVEEAQLFKFFKEEKRYSDGKYCYKQNEEGEKTVHTHSNDCWFNCVIVSGIESINHCLTVEIGETIGVGEIIGKKFYMDTTDEKYTKIKLKADEAHKGEQEIVWIYDEDNKWIAFYHTIKRTLVGPQVISITPWSGTITPPDDLDSYISEESESGLPMTVPYELRRNH